MRKADNKTKFTAWCAEKERSIECLSFLAVDAKDAAEKWAAYEDHRSNEYLIAGYGECVRVLVSDGETTTEFVVSGETVTSYSARLATRGEL